MTLSLLLYPFCFLAGKVEAEMLHTYIQVDSLDRLILCVRLAVLLAVTLTVPVVLFPVRNHMPLDLVSVLNGFSPDHLH